MQLGWARGWTGRHGRTVGALGRWREAGLWIRHTKCTQVHFSVYIYIYICVCVKGRKEEVI
jgi:hypothetical protein